MVDRIAQLYAIAPEAKRVSPEERLTTLASLRARQSKPVLDETRSWLMTQRALPLGAGQGHRLHEQPVAGLVRFLAAPKIPLDSNSVERALRGVADGRKNHYGSRALLPADRVGESLRVDPRAYLRSATPRAVWNPVC